MLSVMKRLRKREMRKRRNDRTKGKESLYTRRLRRTESVSEDNLLEMKVERRRGEEGWTQGQKRMSISRWGIDSGCERRRRGMIPYGRWLLA